MKNKFQSYTIGIYANFVEQNIPTHLHHHDSFELYYLVSGDRKYITNEKIYIITPDSITLTKPNTLHATNGGSYSRVVINFTRDFLCSYYTEQYADMLLSCFSSQMIPMSIVKKNERIKSLFFTILEHYQNQRYDAFAQFLGELLLTLYNIVQDYPDLKSDDNIPQKVKSILDYIYSHTTQIETVDDVANEFFISKYHLMHLFKKYVGVSIMEYITNTKIMLACKYLLSSDKSIHEISVLCGFSSCSYFCKLFKKRMHLTPSDYRNKKKLINRA